MKIILLAAVIAFCLGILVDELFYKTKKAHGVLRIDYSDPNKDTYRIELNSLDGLELKRFIILKVETSLELSQK